MCLVNTEAVIGLQTLLFNELEDVTFEACAVIISTTNNAQLTTAVQATVLTMQDTATGTLHSV